MNPDTTLALFAQAHRQFELQDQDGLIDSIARLRACAAAGDATALIHAELFQSLLSLHRGDKLQALRDLMAARLAAEGGSDLRARAALHLTAARVYLGSGAPADALAVLETARPLADEAGDLLLRTQCALLFMMTFHALAQWNAVEPWRELARLLARKGGFVQVELQCLVDEAGQWLDIAIAGAADPVDVDVAPLHAAERALALYDTALPWLDWPETPVRVRLHQLARRSRALLLLGRTEEAMAEFTRCAAGLADQPHADIEVAVRIGRATILSDRGLLEQATEECRLGIAASEAAGKVDARDALHLLASGIAERLHDLAGAVHHMRQVLSLRATQAEEAAQTLSAVTALRLETEHAVAQAAAERERSARLQQDNQALRHRADSLERDAQLDPLTGAANRRRFDAHLAAAHADAAARQVPLCVAMLDIDYFKRVNDEHGHPVGDLVLQRLVQVVQAQCREGDLVSRLGGEEFAVSFNAIGLGRALAVCQRIRQAVQDSPWHDIAPGLAVTLSIGLADVALHSSPTEGLAAADALLYQAKHAGRNCVAIVPTAAV